MSESFAEAARLPQPERDLAATIAEAEGRATLAVLRGLGDGDWQRTTDCAEWDIRAMASHLVAQCEDSISLRTMLRRKLVGRRRYPGKIGIDAHMSVQVDDHRTEPGPALVEKFMVLWPRAVTARRRTPGLMRRMKVDIGIPGVPRMPIGYVLDVIYNRDLWMHRLDLTRATGQPFVIGDHDRHIVAHVVRDLALCWTTEPVVMELTGPAGGSWLIGTGHPEAVVCADAVAFMRAVSGRDDDVAMELVSGDSTALTTMRHARVPF